MKFMTQKVSRQSTIHTDGFRRYKALKDMGYQLHETVEHNVDEFVRDNIPVNGIESSWSVVKTRLCKFRGIRKSHLYLHLKECEYRFNLRNTNMYKLILANLRFCPLKYS